MKVEFDVPVAMFDSLLQDVRLPRMAYVRQAITTPAAIVDISQGVHDALARIETDALVPRGSRVAIGVGSRGIGNLSEIVACLIRELRSRGCDPFIVPAMGSHGGATAHGQTEVLRHLGITDELVGAPVHASMETVHVGTTPEGIAVHLDRCALEADAIVFVARIKPHTAFHGPYESGLAKMIAIGLGNQIGAASTHARGFGEMARVVPEMAKVALQHAPIRFGLAILENAFDRPYKIQAVPAHKILQSEPALLNEAREAMPRLPFDSLDVLVLDRIGKNISGDGADPNITGRYPTPFATGDLQVNKQVVLDVTNESGGNANGIGTADYTTVRAIRKMQLAATYPNALTSTVAGPVSIPMILPSDRSALAAAVLTCNAVDRAPRIVRLRDTLHLQEFWVSEALLSDERAAHALTVLGELDQIAFDSDENIRA